MLFEDSFLSNHLLSIKVKLKMQLNRDIVKSARLRLTCTIDRNIINKLEKKKTKITFNLLYLIISK